MTGPAASEGRIVGREREISLITTLLEESAAGHPRFVFVEGEGGIGKTALVEAISRIAVARGVLTLRHSIEPRTGDVRNQIWVPLMRAWRESLDRPLSRLDAQSDLPQRRMDETLAFLRESSVSGEVLMAVDDVDLASEEDLASVAFAAEETVSGRLTLLMTYRSSRMSAERSATIARLHGREECDFIRLERLSAGEVSEIVEAAGIRAGTLSHDFVCDISEGNPLVAVALARHVVAAGGEVGRPDIHGLDLCRRIQRVSSDRVRSLTGRDRLLAYYAATIGREFSVLELGECADWVDARSIARFVETAESAYLIRSTGTHPGVYRFLHDLMRIAVLETMDPGTRRAILMKVGRAIEKHYATSREEHAERIYGPLLRSPRAEDRRDGFEIGLLAGDRALARRDWIEARRIFRALVDACDEPGVAAERAAAAHAGLGRAYVARRASSEAVVELQIALDYYGKVADYERMIQLVQWPVDEEPGERHLFPLIEDVCGRIPAGHRGSRELRRRYAHALYVAYGRYEEASRIVRGLLPTEDEPRDDREEARLLIDAAYLDLRLSRFDTAISHARRARALIAGDIASLRHAEILLMEGYSLKGNADRAREQSNRIRETPFPQGGSEHVLRLELRRCEWRVIRAETNRAFDVDSGNYSLFAIRAMCEFHTGHIREGDEYLQRLITVARNHTLGSALARAAASLVILHRCEITGSSSQLPTASEFTESLMQAETVPIVRLRGLIAAAHLAIHDRDTERAHALYRELVTTPRYNLIREHRVERALALLSWLSERRVSAARHFLNAITYARKYEDLPVLAWSYADYADFLAEPMTARGWAEAEQYYHLSHSVAKDGGMGPLVDRVESRLALRTRRAREVAVPERGKALSRREVEVLTLVSKGLSNRDVASTLALSYHTICNHVRHIMRKTGASNRIEAVLYGERTGIL